MKKRRPVVMIVDDVIENIRIVGDILRENGYAVAISDNGKEAIETIKSINPDLILLDIQMPEMDGYEVCKILKNNSETANIPIIFLTAKSSTDEIVKGFEVGGVDYITKPFNIRELNARIKTHLELKFYRDKIEELTLHDEMTGVPNKRYFNKYYEIEWRRAVRERNNLSVIFIDIDFFKDYNDTYGHLEGDKCLRSIAETINNCVERAGDFMARFGGEEFICVLPNTDLKGAMTVAEEIRKNVEELKIPHEKSKISKYVTLSLGVVSCCPAFEKDMNEILIRADKALYEAKSKGRNRVESYQI